MQRRIDQIVDPRTASSHTAATPKESLRRNTADSKIASIDRLIKGMLPNIGLLRQRLERSGWPLKIGDYLLICTGLCLATALLLWLIFDFAIIINLLAGFTIGFGLPHIVIGRQIAKRTKKFAALLPEALDLIVRGVRSGLPVTETMKTIAEEIADPVGAEFQRISDQMRIGVSMDEAMWATAKRLQIPEFNFLVISMSIQQETGGNLAEILENLSNMVRRREQMRLKVKAMSSEARASAMIIGSLPFIMCAIISFINPRYMSTLFVDPRGWIMIAIGLTSMLIGLFIMAKMVRFEI
ncbi:MAG: type II secretion system F family protein [Alphaproteobacteria bacterium]|nr:type II secretion system F family protein [Alphaproteobacteria bacterium]